MNNRYLLHIAENTLKAADRHNVKIQPALRTKLTKLLDLSRKTDTIIIDGPDLGEAITNALINGKDLGSDPDIIRAIVRTHVTSPAGIGAVNERAAAELRAALAEHLEDLIEPFTPVTDQAVDQFTKAHAKLTAAGIRSLTDPNLANATLATAEAGVEGRRAQATIADIRDTIDSIVNALGRGNGSPLGRYVKWIDPEDHTADQLLALGNNPTEWEAITAGHRISIATPTEVNERLARIGITTAEAKREAERDHVQEARAAAYAQARR